MSFFSKSRRWRRMREQLWTHLEPSQYCSRFSNRFSACHLNLPVFWSLDFLGPENDLWRSCAFLQFKIICVFLQHWCSAMSLRIRKKKKINSIQDGYRQGQNAGRVRTVPSVECQPQVYLRPFKEYSPLQWINWFNWGWPMRMVMVKVHVHPVVWTGTWWGTQNK